MAESHYTTGQRKSCIIWNFEICILGQRYWHKHVRLIVRRKDEMHNSWKIFVKFRIGADHLKDLVLNMVMSCGLNEFVDNLDCCQHAKCRIQWRSVVKIAMKLLATKINCLPEEGLLQIAWS